MKFLILFLGLVAAGCAFAQPTYQPTAIWQREGAGDSSLYGSEILALGDQNGDGFNDWAVYAQGLEYAPAGSPNEPIVEFFHGELTPETEPYMVRVADRQTETSIRGARALGDLNGDGYKDWYIFTSAPGDSNGTHIYKIYFGGPGTHDAPDLILTSPILSGYEPIGDFNGDGFDDLFLSGMDIPATIRFGGNPMDTLPDWQRTADLAPDHTGDVNDDGYGDVAAYNNNTGYTSIYLGAAVPDTVPADSFPSMSLDLIHDVNGDGYDDLCFRGSGWGGISWGGINLDMDAEAQLTFPCGGSGPGILSILSAGDFNADGFGDVVMLREWCSNSWYGIMTLHLGHPWMYSEPAFTLSGWTEPLNLIHFSTAAALGDVNGDHVDDLAIGANGGIEHAAQRGKAVVLAGDPALVAPVSEPRAVLPQTLAVSAYPNPFNSQCRITVDLPVPYARIDVTLYNLLGQAAFSTSVVPVGSHLTYTLDAANLATGLYLLRVRAGSLTTTAKLMLLR